MSAPLNTIFGFILLLHVIMEIEWYKEEDTLGI